MADAAVTRSHSRAAEAAAAREQQALPHLLPQRRPASGAKDRWADDSSLPAARLPLLQAKLTIGAADDQYEREADRIADQVMRSRSTSTPRFVFDFSRIPVNANARTNIHPKLKVNAPGNIYEIESEHTVVHSPALVGVIQRKCACGQHTVAGGEYSECRRERVAAPGVSLLQNKVIVNQPGDKYEQEADRVADMVMRMPMPRLQRLASGPTEPTTAPPIVYDVLRSPGQPLDSATRIASATERGMAGKPRRVQTKLTLNAPGDAYEQEADRVADQVMRMPNSEVAGLSNGEENLQRKCAPCASGHGLRPKCAAEEEIQGKPLAPTITPLIHRQAEEPEEEEEESLQAKEVLGRTPEVNPKLESRIQALRGGGQPLPESVRAFFEPRFGYDFGPVRIHTDARGAEMARSVNARALTVGRDVVFAAGEYAPETTAGRKLLAHELTHTVQQSSNHIGLRRRVSMGSSANIVQRYSHEDCSQKDLENHIWPSDHIARKMVAKAIRALRDINDQTVRDLFEKYFKTPTPQVVTILQKLALIESEFDDNDYTYECEETCEGSDEVGKMGAYTGKFWDIHLCMKYLRTLSNNECIARTIVHEFFHKYAGFSDHEYCETSCAPATSIVHMYGCPDTLTPNDALTNPDSYAGFAWGALQLL